jgi:hypothetical protein
VKTWYGYPIAEDAHPERPWWTRIVTIEYSTFPPQPAAWFWRRTDGLSSEDLDAIGYLDATNPRPAPPPLCGQVWRWEPGYFILMSYVRPDGTWCYAGQLNLVQPGANAGGQTWPPPGAVLVYGPGAPWAPADWRPGEKGEAP